MRDVETREEDSGRRFRGFLLTKKVPESQNLHGIFVASCTERTLDVKNVADLCSWTRPNISKPALAGRFVLLRLLLEVSVSSGWHFGQTIG